MVIPSGALPLLLLKYKYAIIFPVSIIEGPVITIICGFLAGQGYLNMYILFIIFLMGDAVGDSLYYLLGRYGGIRALKKWGHRININEEKVEEIAGKFRKHDLKILLISKTQPVGSFTLIAAGMSKMNFWRFNLINFLASIPKVIIFLFIGYYFGSQYSTIDSYMKKIGVILTLILVIGLIVYFMYLRKKK